MPRVRWTLTDRERAEYVRMAERLRTAGADLDPSALGTTESPWSSLKCVRPATSVRAMPGGCVFVIHLRIVALAPKVMLQDFQVTSPDGALNPYVLTDPSVNRSSNQFYLLADRTKFHREEVLNHRVDQEGILRRGDVLEGVLLADSVGPVPAQYQNGSRMRVCLSISNQFDEIQEVTIDLLVERVPTRIQPRTVRHVGLFEGADEPAQLAASEGSQPPPSQRSTAGIRAQSDGEVKAAAEKGQAYRSGKTVAGPHG